MAAVDMNDVNSEHNTQDQEFQSPTSRENMPIPNDNESDEDEDDDPSVVREPRPAPLTHAQRNPLVPTQPIRQPVAKLTQDQKSNKKISAAANKETHDEMMKELVAAKANYEATLAAIAEKYCMGVEYVHKLINTSTHFKDHRMPTAYNAMLHVVSVEVNTGVCLSISRKCHANCSTYSRETPAPSGEAQGVTRDGEERREMADDDRGAEAGVDTGAGPISRGQAPWGSCVKSRGGA